MQFASDLETEPWFKFSWQPPHIHSYQSPKKTDRITRTRPAQQFWLMPKGSKSKGFTFGIWVTTGLAGFCEIRPGEPRTAVVAELRRAGAAAEAEGSLRQGWPSATLLK